MPLLGVLEGVWRLRAAEEVIAEVKANGVAGAEPPLTSRPQAGMASPVRTAQQSDTLFSAFAQTRDLCSV